MKHIKKLCDYCGAVIKRKRFDKKSEHYFCDLVCCGKWRSIHEQGEKNRNWKNNISICEYCKKKFKPRGERKFCSHQCYSKSQKRRIIFKCKQCGKTIERTPATAIRGKSHFCSLKCMSAHRSGNRNHAWQGGKKVVFCEVCVKKIKRKQGYAKQYNHVFCSNECHGLGMLRANNPSWKGGIANEPYCEIWTEKDLKESVKIRDDFRCQNPDCRKNSKRLCVHHIDYDKKNCDHSNLITL